MGTTGLIFGAIVVAWLVYLVPMYLRRDSGKHASHDDAVPRFSANVQIVRDGSAGEDRERVSTPLIRRAMIASMRRAELRAASRRRMVMLLLMVAVVAMVIVCAMGGAPWWSVAIPGGLLVVFGVLGRVSVRLMHQNFDRRLAAINGGGMEETVAVAEPVTVERAKPDGLVESVELGMPVGRPGSLWDPLPITRPTYVSAPPVAGRTVRTIDLTAPDTPVVADAPEESLPVNRLRAVGE